MNEESLLTERVRALIGQTSAPRVVRVEPLALQRLMEALGDRRPLDLEQGAEAPIYALSLLQPDTEALALPIDLPGSLVAGDEWEVRPGSGGPRIGEPLTVTSSIIDITERFSGRYGQMLYVRYEWRFARADGAAVATARRIIGYYRSPGKGEPTDG